ncbi:hypothetical protein [Paenibacillus eucommiae]|uniref:Glycosyltransferase n=1 Tax=Paenibacillus eucommiae TaxID=1355755 RepID=A0ABS4IYG3_9BACL|nr:hypothetical protein [Paenibacillus eucommiae]MBP1992634.1 hypothetical protein [Paenibacillus eucommiae]
MWIGLLWIFGCYGISIALLHIWFGFKNNKQRSAAQVLLITRNNQSQIEWYIRSMFFFSRIRGRELQVTILDEGSTDETMRIIERLSHTYCMDIKWCLPDKSLDDFLEAHGDEAVIVVHLSNRKEIQEIPLFY